MSNENTRQTSLLGVCDRYKRRKIHGSNYLPSVYWKNTQQNFKPSVKKLAGIRSGKRGKNGGNSLPSVFLTMHSTTLYFFIILVFLSLFYFTFLFSFFSLFSFSFYFISSLLFHFPVSFPLPDKKILRVASAHVVVASFEIRVIEPLGAEKMVFGFSFDYENNCTCKLLWSKASKCVEKGIVVLLVF